MARHIERSEVDPAEVSWILFLKPKGAPDLVRGEQWKLATAALGLLSPEEERSADTSNYEQWAFFGFSNMLSIDQDPVPASADETLLTIVADTERQLSVEMRQPINLQRAPICYVVYKDDARNVEWGIVFLTEP